MYALVHKEGFGLQDILALGGDVHCTDENGVCLLQLAVRSATPRVVVDILYYNPAAIFAKRRDTSILMDAVKRDLETESKRGYTGSLALLLLDCGYDISGDQAIRSAYCSLNAPLLKNLRLRQQVVKRIRAELYYPKSLQVCCRNTLRKEMPGHELHEYLSKVSVPARLENYLLMITTLDQFMSDQTVGE